MAKSVVVNVNRRVDSNTYEKIIMWGVEGD